MSRQLNDLSADYSFPKVVFAIWHLALRLLKNNFSYDESKKTYVCYYDDRVVVTYGLPKEK